MIKRAAWGVLGVSLFGLSAVAQTAGGPGIYTCVDAQGRKITQDRPIADCVDREQKILGTTGLVKGTLAPNLTAQERAEKERQQVRALEEQARQAEEKRRERALLTRYPNKSVHDNERAEALAQVAAVRAAAVKRASELLRQRDELNAEMEFYKKDPSKAPSSLRRQIDETNNSLAIQGRFIADQDAETQRLNRRFDEELVRLKQLWAAQAAGPAR